MGNTTRELLMKASNLFAAWLLHEPNPGFINIDMLKRASESLRGSIQAHLATLDAEADIGEQPAPAADLPELPEGEERLPDVPRSVNMACVHGSGELPEDVVAYLLAINKSASRRGQHCRTLHAALTASEKARVEAERDAQQLTLLNNYNADLAEKAQADLKEAEGHLSAVSHHYCVGDWDAVAATKAQKDARAFLSRSKPQAAQQCDGSGERPMTQAELDARDGQHEFFGIDTVACPGCHACQPEKFCGGTKQLPVIHHGLSFSQVRAIVECPPTGCADPACPNRKEG